MTSRNHTDEKIAANTGQMTHAAVIRLAEPGDRDVVACIAESAYAPYISRMDKKPAPMTEDYASRIKDKSLYVLESIEEAAGSRSMPPAPRVRGFLVLLPESEAVLLDNVAVAPDAQGQGFGKMLMLFAEEKARAAGYDTIYLYTNEVMMENLKLYARLGYAETHRTKDKGFNRVFMAKKLR